MNTAKYIWIDGKYAEWKDAKIHLLTHALLYGSAVFEGIHSYSTQKGTAVFRMNEHVERLFHSAKSFGMKIKYSKQDVGNFIKELIRKNKIGDGYVRPTAFYGYGTIGVYPENVPTSLAIISIPWKRYFTKNLRVMVSKYIRHSEKSSVFGVKISGNYANSILAMREARMKGYDEALMLDCHGYAAEGPAENLFIVKGKNLITPASRSALHGITRDTILELSREIGINSYETDVKIEEVKNADELFFCGTMMEIAPIISVNGRKIGGGEKGKITKKIEGRFYSAVRGKEKIYEKWLSYV